MTPLPITFPSFDESEIASLRACLDSKWVTQGPLTKKFEEQFRARHQVGYALATTSCTAALQLSTAALGLGPGDEMIVPAFTWVTSAHCAEYVGARAVFADVKLDTFNLDPKAFEAAITPRTRAVMAVHLFGLSAEMNEILAIARKHSMDVIEDAACAVGTTYDGKPVGGLGTLGCFSFHPRKVISTGEGGMVTTNRADLASKIESLRNHGTTGFPPGDPAIGKPYGMGTFNALGFNLRLSDIQASVGVVQMTKLDRLLTERRRLANGYHRLLGSMEDLAVPKYPDLYGHTYQSYVVRVLRGGQARRNRIMDHLADHKIQTRPGTHAPHRLGYYASKYGIKSEQFPNAAMAEDTTITLPLFPGMTEDQQKFVVQQIREALTS